MSMALQSLVDRWCSRERTAYRPWQGDAGTVWCGRWHDTLMCPPQAIENKRTRDLSEEELTKLRDEVEKYSVEGDLRRFTALNIKRLKEIGCYRGRRHVQVRDWLCS